MYKTILITGGAGYIGSHTSYLLNQLGYKIIIIDKFVHNQNFNQPWAKLIKADIADQNILNQVFAENKIHAIMHFAAFIEVGESVKKPKEFYENNVSKTLNLLNTMLIFGINKFIFSSSCAIYGNPTNIPIDENHQFAPISPYGKNKLCVEFILQDYAKTYDLKYVSLRYFNAAGALPKYNLGEQHDPETHIIPLMLRAIKNNDVFKIFGSDYKTNDGTCIRDYIHVLDIAQAHILALKYIEERNQSNSFNLGSEKGYSVKEMIQEAENICNKKMNSKIYDRRPGDVDVLIADSTKIKTILGWKPKYSDLKFILKSAWKWECKNIFPMKKSASLKNLKTMYN
ncbi:UDP-glucose 4-epimerase GalE [Candidatus Dependentiae bacterium]|nr:UDP-glucose 4-epimerase GalE [Candidatus Dependentiae bacterium]